MSLRLSGIKLNFNLYVNTTIENLNEKIKNKHYSAYLFLFISYMRYYILIEYENKTKQSQFFFM
jgi:hypothetical protein